jgi:hypothetical protein
MPSAIGSARAKQAAYLVLAREDFGAGFVEDAERFSAWCATISRMPPRSGDRRLGIVRRASRELADDVAEVRGLRSVEYSVAPTVRPAMTLG